MFALLVHCEFDNDNVLRVYSCRTVENEDIQNSHSSNYSHIKKVLYLAAAGFALKKICDYTGLTGKIKNKFNEEKENKE